MNNVIGKLSRVLLTIALITIIFLVFALLAVTFLGFVFDAFFKLRPDPMIRWLLAIVFKEPMRMFSLAHFISIAFDFIIWICKNLVFLPVVFMCIAIIILMILQAYRTSKIKKIILRADNMPNSYKFELPKSEHPKTSLVLKIALTGLLAVIFIVCAIARDIPEVAAFTSFMKTVALPTIEQIQYGFSLSSIISLILSIVAFILDMIPYVIYTSLFATLQASCVIGAFVLFTGGRSDEVKELNETVEQKSRFAKIREMEENDEVDELSQLF